MGWRTRGAGRHAGDVGQDHPDLKLRPGIKWHNLPPVNGRVLDAEDIQYNIERMKQPRLPAGANELAWIQEPVDSV